MYFKIFKPISWGERPAERRSRFIQRFHRYRPRRCFRPQWCYRTLHRHSAPAYRRPAQPCALHAGGGTARRSRWLQGPSRAPAGRTTARRQSRRGPRRAAGCRRRERVFRIWFKTNPSYGRFFLCCAYRGNDKAYKPIASVAAFPAQAHRARENVAALSERHRQLRFLWQGFHGLRYPDLSLRGPEGAVAISGRQLRFRR